MKTLTIILIAAALASCTTPFPVAVAVEGQYGTYSYSSKGGLTATIHATK